MEEVLVGVVLCELFIIIIFLFFDLVFVMLDIFIIKKRRKVRIFLLNIKRWMVIWVVIMLKVEIF